MTMRHLRLSGETSFALWWMLPFTILGASTTFHHEMWRDELNAWLIALGSSSLGDLLERVSYEGTPAAWHLLLMLLTRFTDRPEAMQVLHLTVACATAYLCLRLAPFTRLQRVLLVFGYFFAYEYLAIARSYSLTVLCLVVACAASTRPRPRWGLTVVALLVLSQTSVLGLILALAFAGGLLGEQLLATDGTPRISRTALIGGLGVATLGCVAITWQLWRAPEISFAGLWGMGREGRHPGDLLGLLAEVFIPIPRSQTHFWTSSWLWDGSFPTLQVVVGLLVLLYAVASTARRPAAIVSYLLGTVVLLTLFYVKLWGVVRHHGMLFLIFVAAAWLAESPSWGGGEPRWWTASRRARSALLTGLLATHIVGAGIAIWWEHRSVFSQGRAVAEYLRQEGLEDENIVAYKDIAASTVAGYLRGKELYYVQGERFGTFVIWSQERERRVRVGDLIAAMKRLENTSGRKSLLLINQRAKRAAFARYGLHLVRAFDGPTAVSNEVFSLYRLAG